MSYSENEFIKLNRKIKSWEWYTDVNTSHFFIYCLLKANWKDGRFQGKEVKRGSFVSSLEKMKTECGLSVQQIRTAIDKLQSTGEITNKSYTKYRVITVNNYDQYQNNNKQDNNEDNKQVTNNQQTNNKQITTIEEVKKIRTKEVKKNNKPPISPFEELDKTDFSENIKSCLREWFEYKKQKGDKVYPTEIGFKKFINEVTKSVSVHGEEKVKKQFDYAMSRNWSGAYLDKIQNEKKQDSFTVDDIMQIIGKEGE